MRAGSASRWSLDPPANALSRRRQRERQFERMAQRPGDTEASPCQRIRCVRGGDSRRPVRRCNRQRGRALTVAAGRGREPRGLVECLERRHRCDGARSAVIAEPRRHRGRRARDRAESERETRDEGCPKPAWKHGVATVDRVEATRQAQRLPPPRCKWSVPWRGWNSRRRVRWTRGAHEL
jgi:hypothetical protein